MKGLFIGIAVFIILTAAILLIVLNLNSGKTIEQLQRDKRVTEVEIIGATKLRATYKNGKRKMFKRRF